MTYTLPKQSSVCVDDDVSAVSSTGDDFPTDQLSELEASLYVEKWNIPCLRSQSFGLCLTSAIRLIQRYGVDAIETFEELNRFLDNCLRECLTKVGVVYVLYYMRCIII